MSKIYLTCSLVTYKNDINELKLAIDSFLKANLDSRLYIIDNSPTDNIRQFCSHPKIEYIFNNANIGFGAAHNVILNNYNKLGKFHLVLNPDVQFGQGVLEELCRVLEDDPKIGNIMPKIYYNNGELQYLCKLLPTPVDWIVRMFVPLKSIKNLIDHRFEMRFTDYNSIMNVPYLSGCFMLLRSSAIVDIGGFDDKMFMYGEDTDLSRRIFMKYKNLYYPKVSIVHNFEKGSHKKFKLFLIHIQSTIYYLNKWGWFFDKERKAINKEIIKLYS